MVNTTNNLLVKHSKLLIWFFLEIRLMLYLFVGLASTYLIGSFPTAVVVSKLFFGFDIRTRGSGNMGSTNAFRQLGVFWGIVVQVVDILKGFLPVYFFPKIILGNPGNSFQYFINDELALMMILGVVAIAGHVWSIFVSFKGGKGINTALGVLLAISPLEVGACLFVFLLVFLSSGIVSLGSLFATFFYPIFILLRKFVFNYEYSNFALLVSFAVLLFILIVFTHRTNIKRILNGTENRFEKFRIIRFKRRG